MMFYSYYLSRDLNLNILVMISKSLFLSDSGLSPSFLVMSFSGFSTKVMLAPSHEMDNVCFFFSFLLLCLVFFLLLK